MLSERLLAENDSLLKRSRELEAYTKSLEADRAAKLDSSEGLLAQNEALLKQLRELEAYAKNLEADRTAKLDSGAREIKECQDELESRPDRYKFAPALRLWKLQQDATNFGRNSFGALKRPIECTGTSNTLKPMWLSRRPSFLSCANSYER